MPTLSRFLSFSALVVLLGAAAAQEESGPQEPHERKELPFDFAAGKVAAAGVAEIELPGGWRYLQAKEARMVVEQVWGNPPDPGTKGLAIPSESADPRDWPFAVIVSYDDTGHVEDDDAADIDYAALLRTMQDDTRAANVERKKANYPTVELLGWAEAPHYDRAQKKLYWAKRLRFAGGDRDVLNYDVRVLGRRGVLVLQAVADAGMLGEVAEGCKELLAATEFTAGSRYAEFDPAYDKVAAYGIGGLIAGKVLAKAGILKVLLKPLLVGAAILFGVVAKLLGARRRKDADGAMPAPGT
jgi:uncharacterized membrane-anchored protein